VSLAQPELRPAGRGRAVVFAVDASDSVTADQLAWARGLVERAIKSLPPGSQSSIVEFGARAQLPGAIDSLPTSSTDLAAALRLAGSVLARDPGTAPEIVLLTDGWQSTSSVPQDSVPSGVAVSYVRLPP